MAELYDETKANTSYIKDQGYRVIDLWECQWLEMKKTNRDLQRFIAAKLRRPFDRVQSPSQEQILEAVITEKIFGCVLCDIEVPDSLKDYFSEMCPIFKNIEICPEDIGDQMKAFAKQHNIMRRPRQSLIGSMKGKKILLATPLLKWYLEHGLKVSRVYEIIEYTLKRCFEPFGHAVSDARRAGDADPSKAIIADTMKLVRTRSHTTTNKK